MNEFLLLALIIIYFAIRYGAPTDGRGNQQDSASEQSSHLDEKQ
jgi:hypothetical protein